GEPVGRERRRKGTADHEAEESRPRDAHRGGRAESVELLEHALGGDGVLLQRDVEAGQCGDGAGVGCDAALSERVEIARGAIGRGAEQVVHVSSGGAVERLPMLTAKSPYRSTVPPRHSSTAHPLNYGLP